MAGIPKEVNIRDGLCEYASRVFFFASMSIDRS